MYPIGHPAGAAHPAHGAALLPFALSMLALMAGLVVIALCVQRAEGRALRLCPVCGARAVRMSAAEELRGGLVRLGLQCGQCGTWRRAVATPAEIEAQERALQRDRRRIGDAALRLVRVRMRRDLHVFTRALRREVVGADDFLARARPSLPRGRGL